MIHAAAVGNEKEWHARIALEPYHVIDAEASGQPLTEAQGRAFFPELAHVRYRGGPEVAPDPMLQSVKDVAASHWGSPNADTVFVVVAGPREDGKHAMQRFVWQKGEDPDDFTLLTRVIALLCETDPEWKKAFDNWAAFSAKKVEG